MRTTSKSIIPVLLIAAAMSVTSCAPQKVVVQPEPPVVIEKSSPGPTYSLRGPEWTWDRTKKEYVYVAPDYVVKQDGVWVRGHWRQVKGGYQWVPGHWK
ncbi:MAG: YXWGXW repeat-containing protein [Chitinophagales bacterium]